MIVELPKPLEEFVRDAVRSGRYASEEDVVRDALQRLRDQPPTTVPPRGPGVDLVGAMREDADLLEEITQDIMEGRRTRVLRTSDE